jgi:glycosyltransferase involved in cell wall biosynthesis
MSRMQVGLVIYGTLDTVSGGYLYDRYLVDHLRELGHTVQIISLPWRNYLSYLSDNLSSSLVRQLTEGHFDLLLQDELNHPSLWHTNRRLRGRLRCPLVGIVHHLRSNEWRAAWLNRIFRGIERRYLASLDGFVFNSQTTRRSVESLIGPVGRCVVAVPGADRLCPSLTEDRIVKRARLPGPLRLVFVGNVIRRKGLHSLLNALAGLRQVPDWQLDVVGSPTVEPGYYRSLRRQAEALGLGARVNWRGRLSDSALVDCLTSSHLLVVPSSYEGFGIVYVEGFGFGLPALATTAGAACEVITPGRDGWLVPPEDAQAMRECLQEVLGDRERLIELSLAALAHYRAHPTWAQTTEAIGDFLDRMVEATADVPIP